MLSYCISFSDHSLRCSQVFPGVPRCSDSCVLCSLPSQTCNRSLTSPCAHSSGMQALLGGQVGLIPSCILSSQRRADFQQLSPFTHLPKLEDPGVCLFLSSFCAADLPAGSPDLPWTHPRPRSFPYSAVPQTPLLVPPDLHPFHTPHSCQSMTLK